jgi:hypothetical protein
MPPSRSRPALAGALTLLLLLAPPAAAYDDLQRGEGGPTAFDTARLFAGMESQLDQTDIRALFGAGVARDMRIPAEHLRVAFYDAATGERLDRHHMRELMGAAPHDGLVEAFFLAEDLAPDGLPMEVPQLVALLDASFLASMRRPPAIDVEFYDHRCGPRGLRSGGVSGRVPNKPCQPGATAEASAPAPDETPAPETDALTPDPDGWGTLNLTRATHRPLDALPRTREAFLERFRTHGLEPSPDPAVESIPLYAQGRTEAGIVEATRNAIAELEADGRTILRYSRDATELYGDEVLVVYVYAYTRSAIDK